MINRRVANIIVPKSLEGLSALYAGAEDEDNFDFDVYPIPREDLYILIKEGVFNEINQSLDLMIDNYEEEDVEGIDKLYDLHNKIIELENLSKNYVVQFYLAKISILIEKAIKYKTAILFYF